jgi:hypothetical protein
LKNWAAESSEKTNVSDVPVAFMEIARGIRFEFHQIHKPFSVSVSLLISVSHRTSLYPRRCHLQMRVVLRF